MLPAVVPVAALFLEHPKAAHLKRYSSHLAGAQPSRQSADLLEWAATL
jgi:hypothetical protein